MEKPKRRRGVGRAIEWSYEHKKPEERFAGLDAEEKSFENDSHFMNRTVQTDARVPSEAPA